MLDPSVPVRVQKVGKTFSGKLFRAGFRALDGVDLEVGRGMVFGLLGPNGAGKTTLIKILLGLVRGHDGHAALFGSPVGDAAARERVGYLPEAHRLPGYLTGLQVMELFGQMCGREVSFLRQRIPALLERVGMEKDAHRKMREYSKGMQQRIGLAQALIHEPDLVFLDEPTDGVDPVGRAAIREMVTDLKGTGTTIFINSHLLMEVEQLCDRVVIMDKGRILREGTIEELTPRTGVVRFDVPGATEDQLRTALGPDAPQITLRPDGFETTSSDQAVIDRCVDRLRAAGLSLRGLAAHRLNLEQSFIDLVVKQNAGDGTRPSETAAAARLAARPAEAPAGDDAGSGAADPFAGGAPAREDGEAWR